MIGTRFEERLARVERALERMRDLQLAPLEARSQRMSVQIERLARIECKLHTIGEIVISAASFGLGATVGYGVVPVAAGHPQPCNVL